MNPKIVASAILTIGSAITASATAAPLDPAVMSPSEHPSSYSVSPSAKAVILAQYKAAEKIAKNKQINRAGENFVDSDTKGFKDKPGFADFRKPTDKIKNNKINVQKTLERKR